MWVIPLNRENYARNEDYVYHLIDSLYYAHGEWIDNDDATFILPESFTRIDYTHGNIKITDSISCDIDNAFTDSIAIYFYYPSSNKIRLPKDSVSNLSPTGVHNLIKQLKVTMFASDSLTWRSTGAVGPLAAKASPERSEEKKIDVKAIACKFVKAKTFTTKPIRLWYKVTKKISADKISPSASMSI